MSRKPQTNTHWHDASAPNCAQHAAAVRRGHRPNPGRSCVKCRFAVRRRAHRP